MGWAGLNLSGLGHSWGAPGALLGRSGPILWRSWGMWCALKRLILVGRAMNYGVCCLGRAGGPLIFHISRQKTRQTRFGAIPFESGAIPIFSINSYISVFIAFLLSRSDNFATQNAGFWLKIVFWMV